MTDIRPFMEKHADAVFQLPYALAQNAIGETDGGLASLFECDLSDYGSGFANAGGNRIAEALLRHYPVDEIVDRIAGIAMPDIAQRFETPDHLTRESFASIADDVVELWHGALKRAFNVVPDAPVDIDASRHASLRAVTKYLKFQHIHSDELDAPAKPLTGRPI
jgi:hypothetical protein